jgi:hypothetical protein
MEKWKARTSAPANSRDPAINAESPLSPSRFDELLMPVGCFTHYARKWLLDSDESLATRRGYYITERGTLFYNGSW